jgi:hypothetical protein
MNQQDNTAVASKNFPNLDETTAKALLREGSIGRQRQSGNLPPPIRSRRSGWASRTSRSVMTMPSSL